MEASLMRDADAQQAVIGALLLDGEQLAAVRKIISADDFTVPEYAEIFRAACKAHDNGVKPDYLTIKCGVDKTIMRAAMEAVPYTHNAAEYARQVRDAALQREVLALTEDISRGVMSGRSTDETLAAVAQFSQRLQRERGGDVMSSGDAMAAYIAYRRELDTYGRQAVPTGFKALDDILGGGLLKSGFYIIAARPGMGKTTVAAAIADNVAAKGRRVLFYSLEMTTEQISARRIGRHAQIPYTKLMLGTLSPDEYAKVAHTSSRLADFSFFIESRDELKVSDIAEGIRETSPDLVVVDYLGLMSPTQRHRTRYEEMTEISGEVKRLAKRFKVPILCLAQLNRENTTTKDKRPQLSHLRDSGAMEQDADGVILLHREEYYGGGEKREREQIELIVAKNRHGRTGSVHMLWFGATGVIRALWRE